ncbi:serine/threonine-protein kinase [Actinomadura sp. NPDC048394]|uniref:serine/threonine-protein kinase n=1 Tax=Actinomadura sp. NPDC048394 TaxID=3158223 RepID=UPI0034013542
MTSGQTVIDGRFELRGRLGSGGMGTVWRAFDLALHREVALKEVRLAGSDAAEDDPSVAEMMRERVMREARALARLHHPNVVTIHHIVDSPDMPHPWLVMELVPGRSLQDRLADGPLPPAEAAAIGRGILAALRAAHAAGICHRDVKPANVLLRADGTAVLTDFGIAVLEEASRVTATGGLVGSPEYIAPERLHGREGDPASDLWSLGLLLYVAVEGRNPLRRPTAVATLAAVMAARIPPPQHAGPLARALQALLVPDPAARPTASELDDLLAQAADARQNPAPPLPPPPPVHPVGPGTNPSGFSGTAASAPVRRRRRTGLIVGAIVVPVACVAAVLLVTAVIFVPRLLKEAEGADAGAGLPSGTVTPYDAEGPGKAATGPKTLLTPAAIRNVIKKFEAASGSRQFAGMTVYADRANADAPVRGRRGAFDNYTYEKGADAAVKARPSIGVTDDAKVNLNGFNWDALPALMSRAARTLKVPKPTNKYVIIRASWAFNGDRPTMMVYLTDDYGGGYLAANAQGKVVTTVPAD